MVDPSEIGRFAIALILCAVCAVCVALAWIWGMRRYPLQLIYTSIVLMGLIWLLMAAYMFIIGAYIGAILGLVRLFCCC